MVKWMAVLAAALLLGGCDGGKTGDGAGDGDTEVAADEVPFLRKFPASTSGGPAEAARTVIRDPAAWAEWWAKANAHIAPVPGAPKVDFTAEMVAVAALGTRPSAGYSVEIVGVRKEGGKLVLLVAEREPEAALEPVFTAPWHAVVLERSDLPIEWRKYEAPR